MSKKNKKTAAEAEPARGPMPESQLVAFVCCGLLLLTLGVFWDAQHYSFFPIDDPVYIQTNSWVVEGLTPANAARAFVEVRSDNYHPLTQISWMLDTTLFGLEPQAFHRTSILFHLLNTVLLFLVLRRMTGHLWPSALAAALFAVHPQHVESVIWASSRKDVLSTFFMGLVLWFYLDYVRTRSKRHYALVFFFFVLGLLSKQMLVTLPFALCLLDYWPLNRFEDRRITAGKVWEILREKIPLFAVTILFSLLTLWAQFESEAIRSLEQVALFDRLKNAPVAYLAYLAQCAVPVHLQAVGYRTPIGLPLWQSAGALALLVAATALAVWRMRKAPWLVVGWLWFLGTLVPVIGLVSIGADYRADRYTYVPLIGIFIALAWTGHALYEKSKRAGKKRIAAIACALLVLVTGRLGWGQVGYWSDNTVLLSRTLEWDPEHIQSRYALATAYYDESNYGRALEHYLIVAENNPRTGSVQFRLGLTCYRLERYRESEQWYRRGLELEGGDANAWVGLGMAQAKMGQTAQAEQSFRRALAIDPAMGQAITQLDLLYNGGGR